MSKKIKNEETAPGGMEGFNYKEFKFTKENSPQDSKLDRQIYDYSKLKRPKAKHLKLMDDPIYANANKERVLKEEIEQYEWVKNHPELQGIFSGYITPNDPEKYGIRAGLSTYEGNLKVCLHNIEVIKSADPMDKKFFSLPKNPYRQS